MAMRKVDPKRLGDFVQSFLNQGDYRRLIRGRYFRATVASVRALSSGSYTLTVIRNGESSPDGDYYQSNVPGYVPRIGDDVELVWRDESNAVVAYPVSRRGGGGPGPGIADQIAYTAANAGTSPSFQTIPQNGTDLEITFAVRDTSSGTGLGFLTFTLNQVSSASYYYASSTATSGSISIASGDAAQGATSGLGGLVVNGAAQAGAFACGTITIYNYTSSTFTSTWDFRCYALFAQAATDQWFISGGGSNINAFQPITRIDFSTSPAAGSLFTLRVK